MVHRSKKLSKSSTNTTVNENHNPPAKDIGCSLCLIITSIVMFVTCGHWLGALSPQLEAIIVAIAYGVAVSYLWKRTAQAKWGAVIAAIVLFIALPHLDIAARYAALTCALFVLFIALKIKDSTIGSVLHAMISACVILQFMVLAHAHSPYLWYLTAEVNEWMSKIVSAFGGALLTGKPLGLAIFFALLVVCFTVYRNTGVFTTRSFLLTCAGLPLILVLHGWLVHYAWSPHSAQHRTGWQCNPWPALILVDVLLFSLLVVTLGIIFRHSQVILSDPKPPKWHLPQWFLPLAIAIVALIAFFLPPKPPCLSDHSQILLVDEYPLDWRTPQPGKYGQNTFGMFGMLEHYLTASGFDVRRDELDTKNITEVDCLVIFNPSRYFTTSEKQIIWDFVQEGGGLLVAGDHTGHEQVRKPANELLAPMGIELNFDSAVPLTKRWINGLDWRPHPAILPVSGISKLQIMIGASLTIHPPANPILVGQFGFSDPGDLTRSEMGYLGDLRYAPHEQAGQLVLAASSRYGKGRVLVYGDTTSFQNAALAHSAPFIESNFLWLCNQPDRLAPVCFIAVGVLILAAGWLLLYFNNHKTYIIVITSIAVQFGYWMGCSPLHFHKEIPVREEAKPIAVIDFSHIPRCNQEPWQPHSLEGLSSCLMRWGYLPYYAKNSLNAWLEHASIVILPAPAAPFDEEKATHLKTWVQEGGRLILSTGYIDAEGIQTLLDCFELAVEPAALGSLRESDTSCGISIFDAWSVKGSESDTEVLCEALGYPVVIRSNIGKGWITLIGGSEFLHNNSLEMPKKWNERNIAFLRNLLDESIEMEEQE